MATADSEILYSRDFRRRALNIARLTILSGVALGVVAFAAVPLLIIPAVLLIIGGAIAWLTTTIELEVRAGEVTRRTHRTEHHYDASTLQLERKGTPVVLVLAPIAKPTKVICAFRDDDPDHAAEAFRAAGVTIVDPQPESAE
jgi:hypothetical protein